MSTLKTANRWKIIQFVLFTAGISLITTSCFLQEDSKNPTMLGTWELDLEKHPNIKDNTQIIFTDQEKVYIKQTDGRFIEIKVKKVSDSYAPSSEDKIVDIQ